MARGRSSAATAPADDDDEHAGVQALQFQQPLVGKPGRPIGVGDLLARLKLLSDELRALEQEEADRESLEPVAKDLAHHSLLQHKDAGVRAWVAACLVDVFRLCAPDAPYTANQLKEIFTLIVAHVFPLLSDPSNPYNQQHLFVLRSLAEVKSIVLVTDIPGAAQLTSTLFTNCFDVLSGPSKASNGEELSKNVEHHMTAVLTILIDEAPALSSDVVDVIVAQFLWADPISLRSSSTRGKKNVVVDAKQSTLLRKEAPPAYNMAKNLCNACPDKMARLIGTYFSSVIVDFAGTSNGLTKRTRHRAGSDPTIEDDDKGKGPSEEELNDAIKVHRLLRELWKSAPGVLQDIIPHLQEELGTEEIHLRQLATETLGDMISGIGAAGPPPRPEMNPIAYPAQSLAPAQPRPYNFLTTPTSPNSFSSQHPSAYESFLQRKHDKSPIIRASWTTGVGRILMTSAGGVGLDPEAERQLLQSFAECFIDSDERVRLAAVRAVEYFEFHDIIQKLGSMGGMSQPGSILSNLADRVKDKRSVIHSESMKLLGRIWGVAAGAIAEGNERIANLIGPIPSRILEACYVNDKEINVHIDLTLFEALLPLGYPPMKPKAAVSGGSQVVRESQTNGEPGYTESDLDRIRAERQLVLVNGLDEKAKKVFFVKQGNQPLINVMEAFLKYCEDYNGGVMDSGSKDIKSKLEGLINYYGSTLADPDQAAADLWKFAKGHDRRSYQLIRFCMASDSDYRKVFKSIKELRKRIEEGPASSTLGQTLIPLIYRVSLLCYNKSHVPAIIDRSRTDKNGLGATAHEVLREISSKHPKVFSTHVKELCKALESEAPTAQTPNPLGAVQDLKACAGFAKEFPKELPLKDSRKLVQSFVNFALYGSPPEAAKYAISIIVSSDSKKEMRLKSILAKSLEKFEYGSDHFLTKLAAISQIIALVPQDCEDDIDSIIDIAVNRVLLKSHPLTPEAETTWMESPDEDMISRTWALKILVNRLRSLPEGTDPEEVATPIYTMLNRLVRDKGEASKKKATPLGHKNLQRLLASQFLLKLSCSPRLDKLFTPSSFNELALVTHDPCEQIRAGFVAKLMKYLGQGRLTQRFFTILFYCAYEPNSSLLESVTTWIRSRRAAFALRREIVFETVFARLLSLLAHHPDFDTDSESLKMLSKYILFYLKCVATPDNLSLIYHVAQRVKGVADNIDHSAEADERLYILSDLAQALIRIWEDQNGWTLQSWPGKLKLPAGIFKPLESHERAQDIADKVWIKEDLSEKLEPLVRSALRGKKRRVAEGEPKPKKRIKVEKKERTKPDRLNKSTGRKRSTLGGDQEDDLDKQRSLSSSISRRKSDRRSSVKKSYVEVSSEEDEEDTEAGAQEGTEEFDAESIERTPESEDAVMDDQEQRETQPTIRIEKEVKSKPHASPTPRSQKNPPRNKAGRRTNGATEHSFSSPKSTGKVAEPKPDAAKETAPVQATRGKTKVQKTANAASTSLGNGTVRRSARSRG